MRRSYRRYPWSEWMDGHVHDIVHGRDFTMPAKEMINLMHRHARRQDPPLRVMTKYGDPIPAGTIRFRFTKRLWWETQDVSTPGRRS